MGEGQPHLTIPGKPSVGFLCSGMPDYTARLLKQFVREYDGPTVFGATRPLVPVTGMETSLKRPIHWLDQEDTSVTWTKMEGFVPNVVLCGGWKVPAFAALCKQVRDAGGKVIFATDHNWVGSLRQRTVDPFYHKLFIAPHFDAVMVAGEAGKKYARKMGYAADRVHSGMYGADPSLFVSGPPLSDRSKNFLYVGQLIRRKNVLRLVEAFSAIRSRSPEWSLTICGSGPLECEIPAQDGLTFHSFVQPTQLAQIMQNSRALVLPSLEEHWGVVVHEATLCGCALALSNTVGAAADFAYPQNSVLFDPHQVEKIAAALFELTGWTQGQWAAAEKKSIEVSGDFGPSRFSTEMRALVSLVQEDSTPS